MIYHNSPLSVFWTKYDQKGIFSRKRKQKFLFCIKVENPILKETLLIKRINRPRRYLPIWPNPWRGDWPHPSVCCADQGQPVSRLQSCPACWRWVCPAYTACVPVVVCIHLYTNPPENYGFRLFSRILETILIDFYRFLC